MGRHQGARGTFRVGLQAEDVAAGLGGNQRQELAGDVLVDGVEEVDAVVGRHVGDQLADALGVASFDDLDLLFALEIADDLDAGGRIGGLQYGPRLGRREAFHELGRAGRVEGGAEFLERFVVAQFEHFPQFWEVECVNHEGRL